ncbi:MAG: hypothetical protein KGQ94_14365, partial [Alphaproteobacteria bacterium]|nr:hypothetical protein [Alphaproteobacteria bacterium]
MSERQREKTSERMNVHSFSGIPWRAMRRQPAAGEGGAGGEKQPQAEFRAQTEAWRKSARPVSRRRFGLTGM